MPPLKLALLGGFQARVGDGPSLAFPTRKGQALLAYLALKRAQPQPRDKLASLLWGETGEEQSRNSLRQTLFNIRRTLADAAASLVIEGETLMLAPDVWVDALWFDQLAAEGTPAALEQAAALYTGDLLEGLSLREPPFEDWLLVERERLRERAFEVLARLLRHQAETGATEPAIHTAARLLALDPLQEAVHRMLMRLYLRQGRRGAAQRQYQACVEVVQRELSVEVEPETRQLFQEITHRPATDVMSDVPWFEEIRGPRETGRPSVLLVEDERVTRTLLERFLSDGGYEVVVAENGAGALVELGRRRFDVVLSDISMPTLDGLKLLEVMGQKKIATPAIFLTAMPGSDLEVKGFELGAADYIRKPVQKDVLLLRVRNVLRKSGRHGL